MSCEIHNTNELILYTYSPLFKIARNTKNLQIVTMQHILNEKIALH